MTDRADLGFSQKVIEKFRFLESDYGYEREDAHPSLVRYRRPAMAVSIDWWPGEFNASATFYWFTDDRDVPTPVILDAVIGALLPEEVAAMGASRIAETDEQLEIVLARISGWLRRLGPFLRCEDAPLRAARAEFDRLCKNANR